jgi:MraZ protein
MGMGQLFLGQYRYPLNGQSRVMVPASFRDLLSGGAFTTQGFERNILVLTTQVFDEIYQRMAAMNLADPHARLLLRMILGSASQLEMDETGRILIPQNLREFAELDNEAILVGQGDYFEIWAPAQWNKQEIRLRDAETNAERFATLDLTRR